MLASLAGESQIRSLCGSDKQMVGADILFTKTEQLGLHTCPGGKLRVHRSRQTAEVPAGRPGRAGG